MNYIAQFGMTYNPFIKGLSDVKVELNEYKQLLYRLKHLESTKGIGVITGEPGLGKTTAVRYWTHTLNKNSYKIIYIPHSTISVSEFYKLIADELGLEVFSSKRKNFKNIQNEIKRLVIDKRITPVFILDEANSLEPEILNDLKILLNFDMDSKENVILLLVGQSTLISALLRKSNEPLRQRICINYNIQALKDDDARYYIDQKLQAAGLHTELLTTEAYNLIIGESKGVPRVINQLMDKALLFLENMKQTQINEEIALAAIDENTF